MGKFNTTITRVILPTFILIITFISCSTNTRKSENNAGTIAVDSFENNLTDQEYVTNPNDKKIISVPDTLYKGDTLKIKFKTPHPKDFAILTPENQFFYVINSNYDSLMPSLMEPEEFEKMELLEIITDKTKVSPFDARINHNIVAFTKTGKYELRLSEMLCTDDGTPAEIETVYYINRPRKK